MHDWERYKVGNPGRWSTSCSPFDMVSHVSHINSAISIIQKDKILPSLVFDKSILNTERILVSWLSPVYWHVGFRYGSVRFAFDLTELIKGKNIYWVETIDYKIIACRILISDREHNLTRYDPTAKDGPWWFDRTTEKHYHNSNYCLEIMIEDPISLRSIREFDFVKHHPNWCSNYPNAPNRCRELGFSDTKGGAYFLTRAAVTGTDLRELLERLPDDYRRTSAIKSAANHLMIAITGRENPAGTIDSKSEESTALGRAIMAAYTYGRLDEAKLLTAKFKSFEDLAKCISVILADITGKEHWVYE